MAFYGLQYDGINDKGDLASSIMLSNDFKVRFKFTYTNSAIIQGITGTKAASSDIARINSTSQFLFRASGATNTFTFNTNLIQGNVYTLIIERVSGVVDITDENALSVVTATFNTTNGFDVDCLGYRNNTNLSDMLFHEFNVDDNGVEVLNLENTTGTGNSWLDTSGNSNDLALVGFPTDDSQWVLLGSSGITVTVTETGPSFTESISSILTASITSVITESGPGFTESISATLSTLTIQANISESGPSFTESISATVTQTLTINADITEQGPSFAEAITVNLDVNITSAITELGPSFTESINISVIGDRVAAIVESGPSFIESIIATIPIVITVNPKNIIRVKRKSNTVTIKRKSNTIRVR